MNTLNLEEYRIKKDIILQKNHLNKVKHLLKNLVNQYHELMMQSQKFQIFNQNSSEYTFNINHENIKELLKKIYKQERYNKLHLFDQYGTIAVIHIDHNRAWLNPLRTQFYTDDTLNYELANITSLTKVNRRESCVLNDWFWNLMWNSSILASGLVQEDGHYKIDYWPKPFDKNNKKQIFQLSANFIQGAKISALSEKYNIDEMFIKRFIGANIAINNCQKTSIWRTPFASETHKQNQEQGFLKSFFGKLREKLNI